MARQPRLDLSGVAQHVIQRGNDRQPCFAADLDYRNYLQELGEAAQRFGCALHAYVLMTNHVHLLVTPAEVGAVSRMMQALGRRYVACFNARYRRTGTLWEGRFKAGLVGGERHLLACYRYIELNPVRAGMVRLPGDYPWSSHAANALGADDARLTPHPAWLALGRDPSERRTAYRALFDTALPDADVAELRLHTRQQRAWGNPRFQAQIERLTGRSVAARPRGRPPAKDMKGPGK